MAIDREQIQQIAHLARLELDPQAVEKYSKDMSNILALVDQLNQVDVSNVEPMAHPLEVVTTLRADEVTEQNQREHIQGDVAHVDGGLYVVPRVVE